MAPWVPFLLHADPHKVAAYLRVASIAVAAYDYLETLPTAWRFYKQQRRLTVSVVLFFLLRITSIAVLSLSNFTFFYDGFTPKLCSHFVLVVPIFKVLQAMVTQMILATRAFNLSRRSRGIGFFLVTGYILVVVFQWISTIYQRQSMLLEGHWKPVLTPYPLLQGNCRAGGIQRFGAWIYYLAAMTYDFATTVISVIYLVKYRLSSSSSAVMSQITKLMLYDGLGYFFILTAVNIVNLTLFHSHSSIQGSVLHPPVKKPYLRYSFYRPLELP
ncbi:hypothetical protein BDN72DRAFT_955549 [Pluteus cervinus]|uniref:Uncharacterized protein n=1 Tax=Pluteus cervinus TaxID=181527 RepID=A0ACD3BA08_9AGAR|nr:hypothetical protein BDN72DRAFT_955549 [Pluteus cervinus]